MSQPYSFIFAHDGELKSPVMQQEIKDKWTKRAESLQAEGEAKLAGKMMVMRDGIEFVEVNMEAPAEVARRGKEGFGKIMVQQFWPGELGWVGEFAGVQASLQICKSAVWRVRNG